jgi:hypothetical protein
VKAEATPAAEEPRGRTIPVVTWVFGGVGIAALASTAYFGLTGLGDAHYMRDTCKPKCPQSEIDAAHTKLLIANISFGVGVAAIGASLWTALARPGARTGAAEPVADPLRSRRVSSTSGVHPVAIDLSMRPGGAFLNLWAPF